MEVSRRFGTELPKLRDLIKHDFVSVEKPEPGALVLIKTVDTRHVGIMINNKSLLQIMNNGRGSHEIKINHPWIKDRIAGYYKYVG